MHTAVAFRNTKDRKYTNGLMYKEVLNRILTVPVGVLLAAYIKEQTEIN